MYQKSQINIKQLNCMQKLCKFKGLSFGENQCKSQKIYLTRNILKVDEF